MTYRELQDEVIALRFDESRRASIKSWLGLSYASIWDRADWIFKRVPVTSLTVTAGAASEPSDFGQAVALYNSTGDEIPYLEPDDFEPTYSVGTVTAGSGEAFTVINRQLIVGPSDTATYSLAYRRRIAHLDNSGAIVAGAMSADSDQPIWDSGYHYLLVLEACIRGQQFLNDPTWTMLQPQRDEVLQRMMADLAGEGVVDPFVKWGDSWCP